ncbi:MAG: coA-transferase family protein [Rhodoferax sp.]|nr:coA-transferase family protein [Rhodoferax sp.]
MNRMSALDGVRVLDFSKVLAGPMCAQYLGDLGADVIKMEPMEHGDDTRRYPPFMQNGDDSDGTIFLSVNRNKRSFALDLKTEGGRQACHKLAMTADIVIESYGPGVAERLGIGHEALMAANPRLIHCSISGYGNTGPMKEGKGYDAVLQAFSGMLSITGEPGGKPARSPFSPVDQGTGLYALAGILAALYERTRTGRGARVEASLFDTSVGFLGYILQGFWKTGREPQPPGSAHDSLCPYEVFDTADRPVLLGVANDVLWRKFCAVAGVPALAEDERFRTNASRVAHRVETVATVSALLARRSREDWMAALSAAGVPVSPVHSLGEMVAHPHTSEVAMVQRYSHPVYGELNTVAMPVKLDGQRSRTDRPAPLLGQHTHDILRELGYDDAAIGALAEAGAINLARTGQELATR